MSDSEKPHLFTVGAPLDNTKEQEASADLLLRRRPPPEYLQEWESFIRSTKEQQIISDQQAIVIFRVEEEFLAIPAMVVGQVAQLKPIHTIPHQRGPVIRGLVNISGQLRLFICIMSFLQINPSTKNKNRSLNSMMVIEREGDVWAFSVSEVCGVLHLDPSELQNVPVTVSKSTANYLRGVFIWNNEKVGFIDDELLFFSLRRSLT